MTDPAPGENPSDYWQVTIKSAPGGFIFPETFRLFIRDGLPDIRPLYWLLQGLGQVNGWTVILSEQYPTRSLVPFAKMNGDDDVHCFDGSDHSGNPQVFVVHSFTTPGWEDRGRWLSFDDWLLDARETHAEQWPPRDLDD